MKKFLPVALFILLLPYTAWSAAPDNEHPPVPGQVYLKLKPAFAYLNASGTTLRTDTWRELVPGLSVYSTVPLSALVTGGNTAGLRQTGNSGVDLRLYHQLRFDPAVPVQQAIQELQKSGVAELVEPVWANVPVQSANDPQLERQYYLELIQAFSGWQAAGEANSVVIAIIDTGVDMDHPDLAANFYTNEGDLPDGTDNDGDGFVDNHSGWDFAGSDFATLVGDNDPSTRLPNTAHGTMVAGCASAVTNNGVGVAGVANNARLMVLKHTADNDTRLGGGGYLLNVLQGVLYAATHGAHIINASYGNHYYSQIAQDVYRHVTLEYGVLVVAAAGNTNSGRPHYPSDYDYVLSVAASTAQDTKAAFSNYGHGVDVTAPGEGIFTTAAGGGYRNSSGTSFSAPLVAGAAALLKERYPHYTGYQIGELLRVAADTSMRVQLTDALTDKMGYGRLAIASAMEYQGPSVRYRKPRLLLQTGSTSYASGSVSVALTGEFTNYLWPATGVTVKLQALSSYVQVQEDVVTLTALPTGQAVSNESSPFQISYSDETPADYKAIFKLEYASGSYKDYQYITLTLNPSYQNIQENRIATTVGNNGRIGYQDAFRSKGQGFRVNEANILYEMGLMMAAAGGKVLSNVRAAQGTDEDFTATSSIRIAYPGSFADHEVAGSFSDDSATAQLGVSVDYRAYTWADAPADQMILLEYTVKNTEATPLVDFYMGFFADWDINPDSYRDRASWDAATNTGYVYAADTTVQRAVGIQLLSGTSNYWAIDNHASLQNNPFGVQDGYTDEEKYLSLTSGIGRAEAGLSAEGNDVSQAISAGPYTIAPGDSVQILFALHGGSSVAEVLASARMAPDIYVERIAEQRTPTAIHRNHPIPGFLLYPNPAPGSVYLQLPLASSPHPYRLRLLDASGRQQLAREYPPDAGRVRLELPEAKGLFLLEVVQGEQRVVRRLINQ